MNAKGTYIQFEHLPLAERVEQLRGCQSHWYEHAASLLFDLSILDVGAGDGSGAEVLRKSTGKQVVAIDPAPSGPDVLMTDVSDVPIGFFDAVTCIDVVEHVREDCMLVMELFRVSRRYVFITTPNYLVSRAANPYHVREYTPDELIDLVNDAARNASRRIDGVAWWGSDANAEIACIDQVQAVTWNNLALLIAHEGRNG